MVIKQTLSALLVAAVAMAATNPVSAQIYNMGTPARTIGDISTMLQETLYYEAALKLANAKKAVQETANVEDLNTEGTPTVRGVQGVGSQLRATFVYPSGAITLAGAGATLPGGFKVDAVSVDRVVLSRNGRKIQLSFAGQGGAAQSQEPVAGSQLALPPFLQPPSVQAHPVPRQTAQER